jgi:hypothetical protein
MFFLSRLFYPWGVILQALAIVHFIRRRPDSYWLWIIIFGGGLGAIVYLAVEALPDAVLLKNAFGILPRRQRIRQLQAEVAINPAPGNYEELGDLYLQNKQYRKARECFDRAITSRSDSLDPHYRRALAALGMNDFAAAIPDLEKVVRSEPGYDFHRAMGLLAHAYAEHGERQKAEAAFSSAVQQSTLSEIYYYYADFLAHSGRREEAREWANRLLERKRSMPGFQRRRDRPWFRRAQSLRKQLS